nr:hypothetical protein [Tanacetum cinerariifolium]
MLDQEMKKEFDSMSKICVDHLTCLVDKHGDSTKSMLNQAEGLKKVYQVDQSCHPRKDSNPKLELYATSVEKQTRWFIESIQFINGLIDEDLNVSQDDGVCVVSGKCVDLQHNSVLAVSILPANSHKGLNETRVGDNDMLLLEGETFDDARIAKLERILNDNFMFRNDSPNDNHNAINQGLSGSANHPMCQSFGLVIRIHKADGKNDSPNGNQNGVNKRLSCSANDPMSTFSGPDILDGEVAESTFSSPDMDNGEVVVAGLGIQKADGHNDIPNVNHNVVNQAYGNNDYTYSQCDPSTLDVLVQGFDSQKNYQGIEVLQHVTHVDCSVAKVNDHPTVDIDVKAVPVDDFMDVLNDEESIPNYSLDDMKLQDEEDKLITTPAPVNHQPVDELIDVHEDKTTVLQENVKVFFANVKAKRKKCSIKRNYVLRFVKERKKRLAMALDSSFGQQATTTLAPPKIISRSVNGDYIASPEFLEDVSGEPKMRLINELMTLEVFVVQMLRPHSCIRDKLTLPDGFFDFIKMKDPLEYRFPWGYRDIIVDREFWLVLACLDNIKQGWLKDSHLDLWVDLMWYSKESNLNWAMVCPHFLTCTVGRSMTDYYSNGVRYPVAWRDVKKSKGIAVETYELKYMFPKVGRQADNYGDCGAWVCIFLYRLSRNLPLTVDDPLQTVLAYHEQMLQYFWRHKIKPEKS